MSNTRYTQPLNAYVLNSFNGDSNVGSPYSFFLGDVPINSGILDINYLIRNESATTVASAELSFTWSSGSVDSYSFNVIDDTVTGNFINQQCFSTYVPNGLTLSSLQLVNNTSGLQLYISSATVRWIPGINVIYQNE